MSKIKTISATAVMVCAGLAMGITAIGVSNSGGGHDAPRMVSVNAMELQWGEKAREVEIIEVDEFIIREGEVVEFDHDVEIRSAGEVRIEGTLIMADGGPGEDGPSLTIIAEDKVWVLGFLYIGNGGNGFEVGEAGGRGGSFTCVTPLLINASGHTIQAGNGGDGAPAGDAGAGGSVFISGGSTVTGEATEQNALVGGSGGQAGSPYQLPSGWWIEGGRGGDGGDATHIVDPEEKRLRGAAAPGQDMVGADGQDGTPGDPCENGKQGFTANQTIAGSGTTGSSGINADPVIPQAATNGQDGGRGGHATGGRGGHGGDGGNCCGPSSQGLVGDGGDGGVAGHGGKAVGGKGGKAGRGGNGWKGLNGQPDMASGNGGNGGDGGNAWGGDGGNGSYGGSGFPNGGSLGVRKTGGSAAGGAGGALGFGGSGPVNGANGVVGEPGVQQGGDQGQHAADGAVCSHIIP